jgi:hypothetical protein
MSDLHPSPAELERFVRRESDPRADAAIDDHVARCGDCRRWLDRELRLELSLFEIAALPEQTQPAIHQNRGYALGRLWWVPVAAALAFVQVSWLLQRSARGAGVHRLVSVADAAIPADGGLLNDGPGNDPG